MALKDWIKTGGDFEYDNKKTGGFVSIEEEDEDKYDLTIAEPKGARKYKTFKSKKKAETYAQHYMRSH